MYSILSATSRLHQVGTRYCRCMYSILSATSRLHQIGTRYCRCRYSILSATSRFYFVFSIWFRNICDIIHITSDLVWFCKIYSVGTQSAHISFLSLLLWDVWNSVGQGCGSESDFYLAVDQIPIFFFFIGHSFVNSTYGTFHILINRLNILDTYRYLMSKLRVRR